MISDIELKQRKAQELWMASQALNGALEKSLVSGRTRSLMPELMSILNLSGKFISIKSRGLYSFIGPH